MRNPGTLFLTTLYILSMSASLEIPPQAPERQLELTPEQKAKKYVDPEFDTDQFIVVKDRDQWNQYMAEFSSHTKDQNTSVFRTVNPVLCYLALRIFPLEYLDEIEKIFARIRLSTNCGFSKDIVFLSAIDEQSPFTLRRHPHNIVVSSFDNGCYIERKRAGIGKLSCGRVRCQSDCWHSNYLSRHYRNRGKLDSSSQITPED